MKTENILTRVNKALDATRNGVSPRYELEELAADLESQLRNEIAASKGVGNAVKTVAKMLDGERKTRPALGYPWIDKNGRQCVCNGFMAFRFRDHLPLPERPENVGNGIDLDHIYPDSLAGYKELRMPSVKELREFISVERAKYTGRRQDFCPIWDFGPHEPSVNALYLLDAATVFPNAAKIFWITLIKPLVIEDSAGDAIVLPIRTDKQQAEPATDDERKTIEAENERREAIRREDARGKAQAEYNAAQEEAGRTQMAKNNILCDAEKAASEDSKARFMDVYYDLCRDEGNARLRAYAARAKFEPDFDISPNEFEYLVALLHAREIANHNAA